MDEKQNIPVQENPVAQTTATPLNKKQENHPPVGFWPFVGLIVLFSIPIIGWVSALIFLLSSKNKNIKNFSGAHLAVVTMQFIVSLLVSALLFSAVLGLFLPILNNALGTDFTSPSEIFSIASDFARGNYTDALKKMIPTITAISGEELRPFLEELTNGKYEKLLRQVKNEEYYTILNDFENGKYPTLAEKLEPDAYTFLLDELRKEVNGNGSEFIDQMEDFMP